MRVDRQDLEAMFARYVRAVRAFGVMEEHRLEWGSKVDGRAFRVNSYREGQSGQYPAFGVFDGYLGMTKREAYDSLHIIAQALEDVHYHQQQQASEQ